MSLQYLFIVAFLFTCETKVESQQMNQQIDSTPATTSIDEINFESLRQQVHKQLSELDPNLLYHSIHHTFQDVLPNALRIAQVMRNELTEEQVLIIKTAALFHDTGFLDQYDRNEPLGCERARSMLQTFANDENENENRMGGSYAEKHVIDAICVCIMATQMPQSPASDDICAQIVCDADLGHLGTDVYFLRAEALRLELNRVKHLNLSLVDWNRSNCTFLEKHQYFTWGAKQLFQETKVRNLKQLKEMCHPEVSQQ